MWNERDEKRGTHGKFDNLWLGPYRIEDVDGLHSFYLSHLDGEKLPLLINGKVLKLYYTKGRFSNCIIPMLSVIYVD
jgi:hypothetical protein